MTGPVGEVPGSVERRPHGRRVILALAMVAFGLISTSAVYGAVKDEAEVDKFAQEVPLPGLGSAAQGGHDLAQFLWNTAKGQELENKLDEFKKVFDQEVPKFSDWNISGQQEE